MVVIRCFVDGIRDMNRIFDDEMCSLGLDYFAAFGSLLGLRRADRFIPGRLMEI